LSGFIYRWHDRAKNRNYFGSHWGDPNDGYVCSSPRMLRVYKRRPGNFTREILAVVTTSRADLFRREQYWLDRIHDSQFGKSVYNLRERVDNHWHVDDQKRKTVGEKVSEGLKKRYLDPVLGPAS
jgi:hypothetical protein